MTELEEVINKIFDEQEEKFNKMIAEAKQSFKDCYEKYNKELDNFDNED